MNQMGFAVDERQRNTFSDGLTPEEHSERYLDWEQESNRKDARAALLDDLRRLWEGHTWARFGQMLRLAVGDGIWQPAALVDQEVAGGVRAALREHPGQPPPAGPYWDTETHTARTFANGLPRDPARVPSVLAALSAAWTANGDASVGATLTAALDHAKIPENEFNSRLLLVEDARLRRSLDDFGTDLCLRADGEIRLWLDDDRIDRQAPDGWLHVTSAPAAIRALKTGRVVELSLDHDLGHPDFGGRGVNVVNFLAHSLEVRGRNLWPRDGITLHTANPAGRDAMARAIRTDAGRHFNVSESRTPGGKPRFTFAPPPGAH